eukprot:s3764_g2.t2
MEPVGDVESHDSSSSSGLERRRRRSSALILVVILVLTLGLFGTLTLVPGLMASGLLAYSFGLRHAFDVDHIAAIDNITRKLTVSQSSPHTVGMFFALGHSLVVFLACCGILVTKSFMKNMLSTFHAYGAVFGLAISASFLLALGILNLCTARQLWMEWKGHAGDHSHDATMGLWLRCCPRLFHAISKPRHMLIVGFLFGLGFDTATEVGLLGVVAVSHGLAAPICILLLPLLFMSGMCLLDTLNGLMMAWIYRTSVEDDKKKIYFNLFVTVTSGHTCTAGSSGGSNLQMITLSFSEQEGATLPRSKLEVHFLFEGQETAAKCSGQVAGDQVTIIEEEQGTRNSYIGTVEQGGLLIRGTVRCETSGRGNTFEEGSVGSFIMQRLLGKDP